MVSAKHVNENNVAQYDMGGDYLRAVDFLIGGEFRSVTMTISAFFPANTIKTKGGRILDKPVIEFAEPKTSKRRFVLNKTNQTILHILIGDPNGNRSVGFRVKLEARVVSGFGFKELLGLYIIPPIGTILPKSTCDRLGTKVLWAGSVKDGSEIPHKDNADHEPNEDEDTE